MFVCISVYWALPKQNMRIWMIALASCLFYGLWNWHFLLLVLFSAFVDYVCAMFIFHSERLFVRRAWLVFSLTTNVGLLVFFKYTYFLYDNTMGFLSLFGIHIIPPDSWGWKIMLPLGISFYTFHTISYTIDIYRKVITKPIKSYVVFVAYVMFWPQLVAGPILRFGEVVPQLMEKRIFRTEDFTYGLGRIINGLFKKVVIADSIAPFVEYWFDMPHNGMTGFDVWVASALFGFQIYFDFSGYSDIAIGSVKLMGISFPENFNWPYMANSPREFWKRWHISLSSWIRDYLYLPMTGEKFRTKSVDGMAVASEAGGNVSEGKRDRALILTWAIMGLWHGASWTFIIWGLYHGVLIYLYRIIPFLKNLPVKYPRVAWVLMFVLAIISWIPFRAKSVPQTFEMFEKILNPLNYQLSQEVFSFTSRTAAYSYLIAFLIPVCMLLAYRLKDMEFKVIRHPASYVVWRTAMLSVMMFSIILCLQPKQQFIYFQF